MSGETATGQERGQEANIVFDFDDTLIVSRSDRAHLLFQALREFGTPVQFEGIDRAWGRPFKELVAAASPDALSRFSEFLWLYANVLRRHPPTPCAGVLEAIPDLARLHRLFVLSASNSLLVRTDLESLGILGAFEFVCGSDWQTYPKPSPQSLEPIRTLSGAHGGNRCWWYVGDSPADVTLAREAGLRFVGLASQDGNSRRLTKAGVNSSSIIYSMVELPRLMSLP